MNKKTEHWLFDSLIGLAIFYMVIIMYLHPTGTQWFIFSMVIILPLAILFRFLSDYWGRLPIIIAYGWLILVILLQLITILPHVI
jgi:hypothetical protein